MCLQEEASIPPYMNDVVVPLGFLAEVPAGCEEKPSAAEGHQGVVEAIASRNGQSH